MKKIRYKFPILEMKQNITADPADIKRIIGQYEEFCIYKFDNLHKSNQVEKLQLIINKSFEYPYYC